MESVGLVREQTDTVGQNGAQNTASPPLTQE